MDVTHRGGCLHGQDDVSVRTRQVAENLRKVLETLETFDQAGGGVTEAGQVGLWRHPQVTRDLVPEPLDLTGWLERGCPIGTGAEAEGPRWGFAPWHTPHPTDCGSVMAEGPWAVGCCTA